MTASSSSASFSSPLWRCLLFCSALVCFSSSWDIFLTVQLGGTFRVSQLAAVLLLFASSLKCKRTGYLFTLGLFPALLWLAVQLFFIPATDFLPRSIGYCLWLALNLALLFAFVQLFGDNTVHVIQLIRFYLWSFAATAAFGIIQFLLPVFGIPSPLIQQWWIPDVLPRANAFSYEPSYFATYLLIGLVFVNTLRRLHSTLLSRRKLILIGALCGFGILLSSSRMGIIFLCIEFLLPHVAAWWQIVKDALRRRIVLKHIRRLGPSTAMLALASVLCLSAFGFLQRNPALLLIFLNGTGVSDTAAHSVVQREGAFGDTLTVFSEHPLVGRSLGGVASAIADLHGEHITSFEESKLFEGMSIYAEVLAASGLIGVIPFIWFSIATVRKPLTLARTCGSAYSIILRAAVRSLVFALAILQFNQNILRPYLWVHLAILAAAYSVALRTRPDRALAAGAEDDVRSIPSITPQTFSR